MRLSSVLLDQQQAVVSRMNTNSEFWLLDYVLQAILVLLVRLLQYLVLLVLSKQWLVQQLVTTALQATTATHKGCLLLHLLRSVTQGTTVMAVAIYRTLLVLLQLRAINASRDIIVQSDLLHQHNAQQAHMSLEKVLLNAKFVLQGSTVNSDHSNQQSARTDTVLKVPPNPHCVQTVHTAVKY